MTPQELVETLRAQHRTLAADLTQALDAAKEQSVVKDEQVLAYLTAFKVDIVKHLELEDGEFYPDYFEKKNKLRENTEFAEDLEQKMTAIAGAVTGFLEKYSTVEAIAAARDGFAFELKGVISTLTARITVEDDLFELYLLM
jgi:hemerythrin-like domain-containing protein